MRGNNTLAGVLCYGGAWFDTDKRGGITCSSMTTYFMKIETFGHVG